MSITWASAVDVVETSLGSLGDGDWWNSDVITDGSPSNTVVRVFYQITFSSTPIAGDHLWFKIARGDGETTELWDGDITDIETTHTSASAIAEIESAPMPTWRHNWVSNHGTVFVGSRTISLPGRRWSILLSPRGESLSATGHTIRYSYGA